VRHRRVEHPARLAGESLSGPRVAVIEVGDDGVQELGGDVVTPVEPERRGALVCIRSTGADALVAELGERGIVTSTRDGNLRVSPHAYNTQADIETLLDALRDQRAKLGAA
jgi:selenocysteine lyase/cysteine desulfurase